jgi:hypothetical protein
LSIRKKKVRIKIVDPPVPDFLPGPSEGFYHTIDMSVHAIWITIPVPVYGWFLLGICSIEEVSISSS